MAKKKPQGSGAQSAAIEQIATADLIPYARNARTHSEQQVQQIAGSIQEFGFCNPVLIDATNGIIAGHGRVMAAQLLKLESVPCLRLSHLTDAQKRAYVLADNRIALSSGWDEEMLANELSDLHADEFDMSLLGFDADELEKLLALDAGAIDPDAPSTGEIVEDEAPEPPADPITKPGDLWILGEHRVLCGDSTKADDVARLMAGVKADLCFTSPPYDQQRDYTKESKSKGIDWNELMRGVFANLPMTESGQVLVNLGLIHRECEWVPYWEGWIEWMRSQGWRRFGWYVWDQQRGLPGDWNGRFAPSHEFVFHFNREALRPVKHVLCNQERAARERDQVARGSIKTGLRAKNGDVCELTSPEAVGQTHKVPDSVWRFERHMANDIARRNHPATFPVTLPAHAMQSWPGVAYEPFCGSGSTLIAAEQLNRKCCGMEISPAYCDVIVKRWENLTGKTAVLETA